MRFWLYMGIISNILFQIPSTLKPMTIEQYNLNVYCYWGISAILVVMMILSFTWKISILNIGSVIYMARNIMPFYDLEKRKDIMGRESFIFLCNFQTSTIVMHLMLLNNNLDKSMIFITPVTLIALFYGIVVSIFDIDEKTMSGNNGQIFVTLIFCTCIFAIFMYLQKRIHKEVFLGIKNRQH